jgi:DNA-binding GntR family transcriptional regulator
MVAAAPVTGYLPAMTLTNDRSSSGISASQTASNGGEEGDGVERLSALAVVRKIDELIARGRLVPGQRLVEADLMADLGANRTVVREALRFLAGDGVVELIPNRGGRIRKIDAKRLGDMLDVFSGIFRAAMETLGSRPISKETRKAFEAAFERIVQAAKHGSAHDQLDAVFDYHTLIYRRCGNDYFAEALDRLHIHYYIRQAAFEGFLYEGFDLIGTYTKVTDSLINGDIDHAYEILKPGIDRLAVHLRKQRS